MEDQKIICPECGTKIALTETLAKQIKDNLEQEFLAKHKIKEAELDKKVKQLEEEKKLVDKMVEEKVQIKKNEMWAIAQQKAEEKLNLKVKDLEEQNKEKTQKLDEAQKMELDLRKKMREVEEFKKTAELELIRKLDEGKKRIEEEAKKREEEATHLKMLEKDKQLEIMKKTIEDLKRQSEQGSMQIQGEVQENDLKKMLEQYFPYDEIGDVPVGIKGADLIQKVRNNLGQESGIILWESKNTKTFSQDWIKKLKQDQLLAKADVCILVSKILPEEIKKGFGVIEGVWVTDYQSVFSLAESLRFHLLEINQLKKSLVGREKKAEQLLNYLAGSQFKNRIENMVMAFKGLKEDLETEKRSLQRIWSKREKELEQVVLNTSGLYGDLQGLIGGALPTISNLELPSGEGE